MVVADLRAVIRLQPSNTDAIRELTALLASREGEKTLKAIPDENTNSSSSKQVPNPQKETFSEMLRRLGIPEPKPTKQPPFQRTRADDRKLKISLLPCATDAANGKNRKGVSPGGELGHNLQPPTPSRHGKEKAGTMRTKRAHEMELMRVECVTYPSWDRYTIKRVD